MTDPFFAVADPRRRRIIEMLAAGERTAGEIVTQLHEDGGLSQPAVSQHLATLRAANLVAVRADGARRHYSLDPAGLLLIGAWVDHVMPRVDQALDALATEVTRGKRTRHQPGPSESVRDAAS